jgi:MFS family permease
MKKELTNNSFTDDLNGITIAPKRAWLSVIVLVALMALALIDRMTVNLLIDPIRQSFNINDFQISLLQGPTFAVFFLLGSLMMGWLVDRYSNRLLIFIGVIIWSLATILSGLAVSFTMLLIARCIVGLGEAVLQPAGWNIITKLFPAHKLATAIGTLTAGAQIGTGISLLITGFLIADANQSTTSTVLLGGTLEPWQWVFVIVGIPGILLSALIFLIPEKASHKKNNKQNQQKNGNLVQFVKTNSVFIVAHFIGFSLLSIMVYGAAGWVPTYLIRMHSMDIKNIGLLLGLVGVPLALIGVIFAGWLVDRSFKQGKYDAHLKHFAIRSGIIAILGGIGFIIDKNVIVPLITFSLIQFIQPFSGVAGASLQVSIPEKYRGRISAIFIMLYNAVGMALGPSFVVFMSDYFGSGELGIGIALNYIVLGVLAGLSLWIGRKYAAMSHIRYGLSTS